MFYLKNELDTRGYVEGKGWAHSIAHGADLLVSIVEHPKFAKGNYTEILSVVHNCLFKKAAYIDDEDERLAFVLESLIERSLDEERLEQWIEQIFHDLELISQNEGYSNNYFRTKFNVVTFLKTLYFRMGFKYDHCRIRGIINSRLKELHQKLYTN